MAVLSASVSAQERARIIIHSDIPTQIWTADGEQIGMSDKAFALVVPDQGLELVLKADGYQDKKLRFSADELHQNKRFPENGNYAMTRVGVQKLWWLGGLTTLLIGGLIFWKNRPSTNEDTPCQPELEFGDLLGEGNMARVYDSKTPGPNGEELAIKVLRPDVASDQVSLQRFLRESEVGLSLEHPNLVKHYSSGTSSTGQPYLVLEKLDGNDLKTILEQQAKPEISLIREVILSVASALSYLHERHIVHRDLKPANIFMTQEGVVKLVDLGIAKGADLAALTQTGMTVGTPFYMAPEQSSGEASALSDQYSLGVLAFEMLTGQLPFQGDDAIEIVSKHLGTTPPSLRALNPNVSALQEDVVLRMLSKEPNSRFPTIGLAKEALEVALKPEEDCDDTMAFATDV